MNTMARKGGQQRNGLYSQKSSEAGTGHSEVMVQGSEDLNSKTSNSNYKGSSYKPGHYSNLSTKNNKRNRHKNANVTSAGRFSNEGIEQQDDIQCIISNIMDGNLSSDPSEVRVDSEQHSHYAKGDGDQQSSVSQTSATGMGRFVSTFAERIRYFTSVVALTIRGSTHHVLQSAKGWSEEHKPLKTVKIVVKKAQKYVSSRFAYTYPIIRTWVMSSGKPIMLFLTVLLDCNLRGFNSLVRLGTACFFAVLWCSALSLFAMAGVKLMLLLMVSAAAVTVFIGVGFSILIAAISLMILLWLYGSFWTTILVIIVAAILLMLKHERLALLVATLYSMYCAGSYVGWLGLLFGLNLSFFSSDILVHFLTNSANNQGTSGSDSNFEQTQGVRAKYCGQSSTTVDGDPVMPDNGYWADRGPGDPSTSGAEKDISSEDEVIRLMNCSDHYSALGLRRYAIVDASHLKREYRKKAMLVHPDKNMGNEKAAEAFKKLQNAYEILLDSIKRKAYDDELRREELLDYFRRFQSSSQQIGNFRSGFGHSEGVDEGPYGQSRRMACKKCHGFHLWSCTGKCKSRARWCQDCKDFHQAKDGDGWIEQSSQPIMFGLLQKMDPPRAYVCADSLIFDVTEWFSCQGMRCPCNTHKPSFHVSTNLVKPKAGSSSAQRGGMPASMIEDEFFEWLEAAVQSGALDSFGMEDESPSASGTGGNSGSRGSAKKKRKGRKQW